VNKPQPKFKRKENTTMTKLLLKLMIAVAVLSVVSVVLDTPPPQQTMQAQTAVTTTALSRALNMTDTVLYVVSATGFTASSGTATYYVYIDREAMEIRSVSGTTITVRRGQLQTNQTSHRSGAIAVVGLAERFISQDPYPGSCTRATDQRFTPLINVVTGTWWDCSTVDTAAVLSASNPGNPDAGVWQGVNLMGFANVVPYKNPGNQAYTALLSDFFIDMNSMTAGRTITLPAVTDLRGKIYIIKHSAAAQTLTVASSAGQYIVTIGTTTQTLSAGQSAMFISVGGGWATFGTLSGAQ